MEAWGHGSREAGKQGTANCELEKHLKGMLYANFFGFAFFNLYCFLLRLFQLPS